MADQLTTKSGLKRAGSRPGSTAKTTFSKALYRGVAVAFTTLVCVLPSAGRHAAAANASILHMHEHLDPGRPYASPVLDGAGYLYGTTYFGGPASAGTISRIRTDGTGEEVLHWFTGGPHNGARPYAAPILDGAGYLYGTTAGGGPADAGTIYKIRTNGTGFEILHAFSGDGTTGLGPDVSLVLDSSGYMYGVSYYGGTSVIDGVVFRLLTNGTGFQVLRNFKGGASDGSNPYASLILDESGYLYGTTERGGANDGGTIFRMKTDGTGFQLLHSFEMTRDGGFRPSSALSLDGAGNLYGATPYGGTSNVGVAFTIKTDGTGFQILHSFAGGSSDGASPESGFVLDGTGNLIGTTSAGGAQNLGTLYTMKTDGSGYRILHSFDGYPGDGEHPLSPLIRDSSGTLYGATPGGGSSNYGAVFKLRADGSAFQILYSFPGAGSDGMSPWADLLLDGSGTLFGTTYGGGSASRGTVFAMRPDGSGYRILHSFSSGLFDGGSPYAGLVVDSSGTLYGTTYYGGTMDLGTVFRIRTDGTGFQLLHSFSSAPSDGSRPRASLVLDGKGNLFGTTLYGGSQGLGTVFRLRTDGSGFVVVHSFTNGAADGASPYAALILGQSDTLFGTTYGGGEGSSGTVFSLQTDGTGFRILHSFKGGTSDGSRPYSAVLLDGEGSLYGTTYGGGTSGVGTLYKIRSDGTAFQLLRSFKGGTNDGSRPYSALIAGSGGTLYGTTYSGGQTNDGTVFKVANDGTGFEVLHFFAHGQADGANPGAALVRDGSGNLYGTTPRGGNGDFGTEFVVQDSCGSVVPPVVRAPAAVTPARIFKAAVVTEPGMTYRWAVSGNGTLTSGQGTSAITITPGSEGTVTVRVTGTNSAGCLTPETSVTVSILEPAKFLSLQSGKVLVHVAWRSQYSGQSGIATAIPKGDQFGYFYFSDANNPEVFVKVLDFGSSSPYLLFWAGLTDLEYTVFFTNTSTWASTSFNKPAGSTAGGANTTSLPHVRAVAWDPDLNVVRELPGPELQAGAGAGDRRNGTENPEKANPWTVELRRNVPGPAGDGEILLANGQVAVSVSWRSQYSGQSGMATAIPQKDEFCFFTFFDQQNPEVFVKVLDWGPQVPFKIFAAGLTDLEYEVTFRNVRSGAAVTFKKQPGTYDGYAANMER